MTMRKLLLFGSLFGVLWACTPAVESVGETTPWEPPVVETVEVAQTLGCADATAEPNQWIAFRRDVTVDAVPKAAPARGRFFAAAARRFELYRLRWYVI